LANDEIRVAKEIMEKMAEEARTNPGTSGCPELLEDGGAGDLDNIATWIASLAYAAGQRVRLVFARPAGQPYGAFFVEVFHQGMPTPQSVAHLPKEVQSGHHPELPPFQWVPILAHHAWIGEGAEILTWKRELEVEL
jgi:hypothetical protein